MARLASIKSFTNTCGSDDESKRFDINNDNTYDKCLDNKSAVNEGSIGDSLEVIISTPAPEEEQQTLGPEISENGLESD